MSADPCGTVEAMIPVFPLAAIVGQSIDLLLLVTGVLAALAFAIWKVIIPGSKFITTVDEEVAPNIQYMHHLEKLDPMMENLEKLDPMMSVLEDIAKQVQRDSGSSMRDEMDELAGYARENRTAAAEAKQAAIDAKEAAEEFARTNAAGIVAAAENARKIEQGLKELEVLVGTMREHARDERELARGDRDLARDDRVLASDALARLVDLLASATRTEESGARIEAARAVVAEDLAATKKVADEVADHEPPGSAADAASRSPEDADGE